MVQALDMTSLGIRRATPDAVSDPNASDDVLFAAVAKGDEAAFAVLVDRYLPKLLVIATRMLGNPGEADDIAQETLMRVWTKSALWRPGSAKFSTWLHRIAMNLCIDRLRRRSFQPLEDADWVPDNSADPARDTDRAKLKHAVTDALNALPGKQKAAIVLCHYEGYTGKEAAKILGISVLAVQSLLVRARTSLKQTLADYADLGDVE